MASGKKKLLVAGLLTAVAAGAFYTFSGNDKPAATQQQAQPVDVNAIYERVDQLDFITAHTKDGQTVQIYIDVPQLSNGGTITDAALAKDIRAQTRMGLMRDIFQWKKSELGANVGSIENDLALFLGRNVTLGVDKNGALIPAAEGVNFGAPKVQLIVDPKTNEVLFKLPPSAPATVAPALPKPPGA